MQGSKEPEPTQYGPPWGTVMIVIAIILAVAIATEDGSIGGDAAVSVYTAIVAYVLGATNGALARGRRSKG